MSQREQATLPAGLRALGNTCWLNAILQALASCSALLEQLQKAAVALDAAQPAPAAAAAATAGRPAAPHAALAAALLDCLQRLQPTARPSATFSPRSLLDLLHARLPAGALEAGEEHDAAEGLELLCSLVAAELQAACGGSPARQLLGRASLAALLSGGGCRDAEAGAGERLRPGDGIGASRTAGSDAADTLAPPSGSGSSSRGSAGSGGSDHSSRAASSRLPPPPPDPLLAAWRQRARLPLQGSTAAELQCARCHHRSWLELAPFWVLPLGIPTAPGRTLLGSVPAAPGASLEGCLAAFFSFELLQGWHCTRCSLAASLEAAAGEGDRQQQQQQGQLVRLQQVLARGGLLLESEAHRAALEQAGMAWLPRPSPAVKRCVAAALPSVLCLQLRRGFWSQHGHVKISGRVAFPLRLSLPPDLVPRMGHEQPLGGDARCSSTAGRAAAAGAAAQGASASGAGGAADDSASSPVPPPPPQQQQPVYLLRGVVVHHGFGAGSGHYTCYRCLEKSPLEQAAAGAAGARWACASDEDVRPVAVAEVLAAEASLLVYERLQGQAGACGAAAAGQQQAAAGGRDGGNGAAQPG